VPANALSTTAGAVASVAGGGVGLGLSRLAGGDGGYALLALCAAVPYLAASAIAVRFPRGSLGPDLSERSAAPSAAPSAASSARDVVAGMVAGARHAWRRPPAAAVLASVALLRLWSGLLTLMTLLLYRNAFPGGGLLGGGPLGLGAAVGAGAAGTLLAAVVTPAAVRVLGRARWAAGVLAAGGPLELVLGAPFRPAPVLAGALVLGFVGQAVKICVDATLQEVVADDFRGRVFSVYDTLFNVAYVVALVVGAAVLPRSGESLGVLAAVAAGHLLTAHLYWSATARKTRPSHSTHAP
jgi:hypothetical protein